MIIAQKCVRDSSLGRGWKQSGSDTCSLLPRIRGILPGIRSKITVVAAFFPFPAYFTGFLGLFSFTCRIAGVVVYKFEHCIVLIGWLSQCVHC